MNDKMMVFNLVKSIIAEILPDINETEIHIKESLKDIGANSIDRMEIVAESMEKLGIKIPLMDFANVNNIEGMVDVLVSAVTRKNVA